MNKYIFTGNLTKDCRRARTPNDKAVCNFTVAVSDGHGETQHTEYVDCALFGKRAEGKLPDYLVKGQKVLIEGRPKISTREHNGKHYANINVFVEDVELVGGQKRENAGNDAPQEPSDLGGFPDDIPFAPLSGKIY